MGGSVNNFYQNYGFYFVDPGGNRGWCQVEFFRRLREG